MNYYAAGAAAAGAVILFVFVGLIVATASILKLVAWCKLFSKATLPWERMFVPIYGEYWTYKMVRAKNLFWIRLGLTAGTIVFSALLALAGEVGAILNMILYIMTGIAQLALHCIYSFRLAKAYGKDGGFTVGLILLDFVFLLMLAFGDAQYRYRIRHRNPAQ